MWAAPVHHGADAKSDTLTLTSQAQGGIRTSHRDGNADRGASSCQATALKLFRNSLDVIRRFLVNMMCRGRSVPCSTFMVRNMKDHLRPAAPAVCGENKFIVDFSINSWKQQLT